MCVIVHLWPPKLTIIFQKMDWAAQGRVEPSDLLWMLALQYCYQWPHYLCRNYVILKGFCLVKIHKIYFMWPAVLLSIIILLDQIFLPVWLLTFHQSVLNTHHSVIYKNTKPFGKIRSKLKLLMILPKLVHPNRSSAKTKTRTPDSQSNAFVLWLLCFPSKRQTF